MTKEEALSWLKDFMNECESQDNRGTAKPIQFLLQVRRDYVAHPDYNLGSTTRWFHSELQRDFETREEAEKALADYGFKGKELKEKIEELEELEIGHYWETEQCFLTERGYKQHIEINGHNLRHYKKYVVHAFRNPELRSLFDAIKALINENNDPS